ncbi:uracil-DNA glycosylase [Salipaludibacillus aurantiacus]|uniref:Type-5 uracil-DNA glycosylase n=1 Tax=Salipaludibacillus aurantiacus TaxID=1601833 RepID=A0A1H9WC64_9BACI|nr:uracil-DNA glycosylase [Salipaludibacillus aurantiacus]SES31542.1 uracil-DNA glycosylase, family 4 [Salipaludibacillus aurantiacus]
MGLETLNDTILKCNKCPRLREWCLQQEGSKKKFENETYWKLPLPGFGDPEAKVLITGLAPAAHGGNRTGRVFTGDTSGEYLFSALYRHGFSSRKDSLYRNDGLSLTDVYITNVVKCAPPKNRPDASEFHTCSPFLIEEMRQLKQVKVILALGGQAFDKTRRVLRDMGANVGGAAFGHAVIYDLGPGFPVLAGSYHPSLYNINTRRVTPAMLDDVFESIKTYL